MPRTADFLDAYARDEYWRIAPGLHTLGLLTAADLMPFSAYCIAFSRWRTAEETLATMAAKDGVTHGLLIKSQDGNPRQNPVARIAASAPADMVRYAGEFGLAPAARARIAGGISGPPTGSKFDGLLA